MRTLLLAAMLLPFAHPSRGQGTANAPHLEFDVASIKENKAGFGPDGMPQRSNVPLGPGAMYKPTSGVFSAINQPVWMYIVFAYKMTDHEVESLQKQLPSWALDENYDVQARTDKQDVTKDEMRLMMQSLLADRLKFAVHTTTEQVSVYGLVLAKPGKLGPKLRPHPADDSSCPTAAVPAASTNGAPADPAPRVAADGFPVVCGGLAAFPASAPGRLALGYRNAPLKLIALQMTGIGDLNRPVLDQTGLQGNYDFALEFAPQRGPDEPALPDSEAGGPMFQQALLEQTGLKLVSQKGPVDNIVVDHIERPSAN